MRPFTITTVLAAGAVAGICASQTPAAAGNLILDGSLVSGGAYIDAAGNVTRQILFTCTGDHTSVTYTIYGRIIPGGPLVTEAVAGVNGTTTTSANYFYEVTRITNSAVPPGALTVGTNGVGASLPIVVDRYVDANNVGFNHKVTGTVNYTLQWTSSNPFDGSPMPLWTDDATDVTKAADFGYMCTYVPGAFRLKINSGTGSVATTVSQLGK